MASTRDLKLHNTLTELIAHLQVDEDPDTLLDILKQPKVSSYSTTALADHIAHKASVLKNASPQKFHNLFERLNSYQLRELEPLLYILKQAHSDPGLASVLKTPSFHKSRSMTFQHTPSRLKKSMASSPAISRAGGSSTMQGSTLNDSTYPFTKSDIGIQPCQTRKAPLPRDVRVQESLVIEDLLYCMLAIDGEYITRNGNEFFVDPDMDSSLSVLVLRMLPVFRYYQHLEEFIEEHASFEYGKTYHAFCASLRGILQDYQLLVAQLEHQAHTDPDFSLQKMWFYISPSIETLGTIDQLLTNIEQKELHQRKAELHLILQDSSKVGGSLLTILSERMNLMGGSDKTRDVYSHLLKDSAKPYFEILREWVCEGYLDDQFGEFMIQEKSIPKERLLDDYNDTYWEQRYTLQHDLVPKFLEKYKEKILTTGKYLNVLRECQRNIQVLEPEIVKPVTGIPAALKVVNGDALLEVIESAYSQSNESLLNLLRHELQLRNRLKTLKTFFLLSQSDYLTHFLDIAEDHLLCMVDQISLPKVMSLLELVLRTPSTTSSIDPFNVDVRIEFSGMTLLEQLIKINSMVGIDMKKHIQNLKSSKPFSIQDSLASSTNIEVNLELLRGDKPLTGVDCFMLNYTAPFPLSLVLNRKIMTKYQMLFRHVFQCKYLERHLSQVWLRESKLQDKEKRQTIASMSMTRAKMLHFVQQLIYFMFFEVIEPQWANMDVAIHNVRFLNTGKNS
jgi:gamma-tubulin complex component 2